MPNLFSLAAAALLLTPAPAPAQSPEFDQPTRPQVHFSPRKNWTNDPNGLVFFHGEYHLFYQYNPFGDQWGHMSWGHAVSPDLLHWHELPVAIPESGNTMIFTGSVVVDHTNSSQLCLPNTECLVAIYTGAVLQPEPGHQFQNLASSQDNGRTWQQYPGNPVLDLHLADFRDPAVSWNEVDKSWVMAVALPKEHKVRFYRSPNLTQWQQLSDFGPLGDIAGDWECPDLLPVPSSDPHHPGLWALKVGLNPGAPQGGSGEQFFLGNFDGKSFTPSTLPGAHGYTNYGKDDYCAISYNNLPAVAGRPQQPVLLGWMSNWQYAKFLPTAPFRGQMSLPRHLTLLHDAAGLTLKQTPITLPLRSGPPEPLSSNPALPPSNPVLPLSNPALPPSQATPLSPRARSRDPLQQPPNPDGNLLATTDAPFELKLSFTPTPADQTFGLRLRTDETHYTDITFDRPHNQFSVDRTHASAQTVSPDFPTRTVAPLVATRPFDLHLIVDRTSVEAYAQSGTVAMTDLIFPPSTQTRIELLPETGPQIKVTGQLWRLTSIWP